MEFTYPSVSLPIATPRTLGFLNLSHMDGTRTRSEKLPRRLAESQHLPLTLPLLESGIPESFRQPIPLFIKFDFFGSFWDLSGT